MHDTDRRHALVFAIAHEIGNHLAGIRLEAHLIDEEQGARGLAKASLAIDSLAGQSGPLLALLRPLLAPGERRAGSGTCERLLEGVRRQLEEEGTAGHRVELAIAAEAGACPPPFEGLHSLVVALVGPPEALAGDGSPIALRLERVGGELVLAIELPGPGFVEAAAEAAAEGAGDGDPVARVRGLRGCALALELARVLVADAGGGGVTVGAGSGRSWVALRLPG